MAYPPTPHLRSLPLLSVRICVYSLPKDHGTGRGKGMEHSIVMCSDMSDESGSG